MKVLVVGSGGREHALAWKLAASPNVGQVFVAPGNAGTLEEEGVSNVNLDVMDFDGLVAFAAENGIGLTVVGPELPLAAGIVDRFRDSGLHCLGPTAAAARLEASKSFAKEFMVRNGIPTAGHGEFTTLEPALAHVAEADLPVVIKADGLAAGKGVVVAHDRGSAVAAVNGMLSGIQFGQAGRRVVIEEFLQGEEASFICMVDGRDILPMASSQDHKAAHDGDLGPNTGGMGAYSPAPVVDDALAERILDEVIRPVVRGMADEGTTYTGFLYAGLMIDEDRSLRVIEFNCRFGDPEAQPVLSRLRSDFAAHCLATVHGSLGGERANWDPRACLGVVMAAEGYPGDCAKGREIHGLGDVPDGVKVFHAGTACTDGRVVTDGGRVLCVTASGGSVAAAQALAYRGAGQIHWEGSWCRRDIGYRAIGRERGKTGRGDAQ